MDGDLGDRQTGWRGSAEGWLDAAYQALVTSGVEAVKVMPLATGLGLSRTSFYHHFDSREALLNALLIRWRDKNTGNLVARTEAYAESITESMFNLFDCWLDPHLFDAAFDLAVRNWAASAPDVANAVRAADAARVEAIAAMFRRFGYQDAQAEVRALTSYYTQIGYYSMKVTEPEDVRYSRMADYVETFTGRKPWSGEIARFMARHNRQG